MNLAQRTWMDIMENEGIVVEPLTLSPKPNLVTVDIEVTLLGSNPAEISASLVETHLHDSYLDLLFSTEEKIQFGFEGFKFTGIVKGLLTQDGARSLASVGIMKKETAVTVTGSGGNLKLRQDSARRFAPSLPSCLR